MKMQYRKYALNPEVDEYFCNNYNKYQTLPLSKKKVMLPNLKDSDILKNNTIPITLKIKSQGAICSDVFIKLNDIPPTVITNINVKKENGLDVPFYNLDWLTIYLYNLRCYPKLVEQNIFVLPNLVMLNRNSFGYFFEIVFDESKLYQHYFKLIRKKTLLTFPLPIDVGNIILKYLANYIDIDIWHRTSILGGVNSVECRMVCFIYTAHKNIFSQCHKIPIHGNYSKIELHQNVLLQNILFTIIYEDDPTLYSTINNFEQLIIKDRNNQSLNMTSVDFNVIPSIISRHFVNKKKIENYSTFPIKFNLTENITTAGQHPHMYKLDLGQLINHSVIMNYDPIDPGDNLISIEFYTKSCKKNAYIYLEIATS